MRKPAGTAVFARLERPSPGDPDVSQSIHDFHDDPRNERILIWVNGALKPRAEAVVSVFDSGFVLGDGVWEGLRVAGGHPLFLDEHLDRLYEGAKAIALVNSRSPASTSTRVASATRTRSTRRSLPPPMIMTVPVAAWPGYTLACVSTVSTSTPEPENIPFLAMSSDGSRTGPTRS